MFGEGELTGQLWKGVEETLFPAILEHPFVRGLTDGTLPEASFRYYVVQDSLYLREFGRGLALLGARSETGRELEMFCRHASNSVAVEQALHQGYLSGWGWTEGDLDKAVLAPNGLAYVSWLLSTVYDRPYGEALGAFLPCYWIYGKVGLALQSKGSPNPLYQKWVDTYSGEEFGKVVAELLAVVNRVGEGLGVESRARLSRNFRQGCVYEYLFWDMAWQRQEWPL